MMSRSALAARLFAAQALVLVSGAVLLGVVAAFVGPAIVHRWLRETTGTVDAQTGRQLEEACASANARAFGVAMAVGVGVALAVSALIACRVARPVGKLADAAAEVADGNHAVPVAPPHLGPEFDTLAAAFAAMAARLEAVEHTRRRLLSELGQELSTPLATIDAYLDSVDRANGDEEALSVLRAQTARLHRLAEEITSPPLAEEQGPELMLVSLAPAELIDSAVSAALPRFGAKGVELNQELAQDVPKVRADPDRIRQVLGHLLDNSLRHTPPGGRVTVWLRPGVSGVELSVTDTGDGIAEEHMPHVFDRFYRADTARDRGHDGAGMGLAIVRSVVDEHGGQVTAWSDGKNAGTTITFTLPRAADGAPPKC